mgnify:CR=1 FL=1
MNGSECIALHGSQKSAIMLCTRNRWLIKQALWDNRAKLPFRLDASRVTADEAKTEGVQSIMHDEKLETFSGVFTRINDLYPRKILDFKEERVIPLDERTIFMFKSLLPRGSQSYFFIHEPEEVFRDISDNRRRELRRRTRQESGVDFVFV